MLPENTQIWTKPMDPKNEDFYDIGVGGLLQAGETVTSLDVVVTPEALAAGLVLGTGAYAPQDIDNVTKRVWLSIDPAKQNSKDFMGKGSLLALETKIVTNANPPRTLNRYAAVKVIRNGG